MTNALNKLIQAEEKAIIIFKEIEERKLITYNKSEKELNTEIFNLAFELFQIDKYWHKRIVRSGANTLKPYNENPENLIIQEDDILFLDFGPIFEDFEADFGRTYVIGNNPQKIKLKQDVEIAWNEISTWMKAQTFLTGAAVYARAKSTAIAMGWELGGEIAGHLIGQFPHEKLEPKSYGLYFHPKNPNNIFELDSDGNERNWILEIHFIDAKLQIGSFFEQLIR